MKPQSNDSLLQAALEALETLKSMHLRSEDAAVMVELEAAIKKYRKESETGAI